MAWRDGRRPVARLLRMMAWRAANRGNQRQEGCELGVPGGLCGSIDLLKTIKVLGVARVLHDGGVEPRGGRPVPATGVPPSLHARPPTVRAAPVEENSPSRYLFFRA